MRQEAELTQAQLAEAIGISRETVVAIENAHPNTVKALSTTIIKYWFNICRTGEKEPTKAQLKNSRLQESTELQFKAALLSKLGF